MTMLHTKTVRTYHPARPVSFLQRIAIWHRAWVEHHKMQKLDAAALRDMGIEARDRDAVTVGEIAARIRQQGS